MAAFPSRRPRSLDAFGLFGKALQPVQKGKPLRLLKERISKTPLVQTSSSSAWIFLAQVLRSLARLEDQSSDYSPVSLSYNSDVFEVAKVFETVGELSEGKITMESIFLSEARRVAISWSKTKLER
jgi:hypothetical protein